jgi:hypothetical protein
VASCFRAAITALLVRLIREADDVLFARDIVPTVEMVVPDSTDHAAALEVFRCLARGRRLSYCDAVSFVIVRQRLGDMACLAFDRDGVGPRMPGVAGGYESDLFARKDLGTIWPSELTDAPIT